MTSSTEPSLHQTFIYLIWERYLYKWTFDDHISLPCRLQKFLRGNKERDTEGKGQLWLIGFKPFWKKHVLLPPFFFLDKKWVKWNAFLFVQLFVSWDKAYSSTRFNLCKLVPKFFTSLPFLSLEVVACRRYTVHCCSSKFWSEFLGFTRLLTITM